jgi:hypothetical protein
MVLTKISFKAEICSKARVIARAQGDPPLHLAESANSEMCQMDIVVNGDRLPRLPMINDVTGAVAIALEHRESSAFYGH